MSGTVLAGILGQLVFLKVTDISVIIRMGDTRTVLLGGRHDGLGGGRRGATQGSYKLNIPGQPVQAALKQA